MILDHRQVTAMLELMQNMQIYQQIHHPIFIYFHISNIFDLLMGITFLLSKLKISKAVRMVQLVLIFVNSELIKLFLFESYSTSIIPPSIGYNEESI